MALELDEAPAGVTPASTRDGTAAGDVEEAAPPMARRVIALAGPIISQNLLETLVGVVDTLLVARLGAVAIAGVGTALQVMFFLLAALSAVTTGASIVVAHAVGAADWGGAKAAAKQAIVWGLLASLPLALAGALGADRLIGAFRVAPDVRAVGADYLRITMVMFPALLLVFVTGAVLRGAGDSRTPLLVSLLANAINGVLAYGLIWGHLGLPRLGAAGSAWAAAARASAGWVLVWMGLMGTLYFIFARPIMGLFSTEPAVIDLGARSLRALALSQPFWGQLFVWSGALRGAGNTRFPLIANTIGIWAVVAASFVAVNRFGAELPVLWAFFLPSSALNALADWLRFCRGDWSVVRVPKETGGDAVTA